MPERMTSDQQTPALPIFPGVQSSMQSDKRLSSLEGKVDGLRAYVPHILSAIALIGAVYAAYKDSKGQAVDPTVAALIKAVNDKASAEKIPIATPQQSGDIAKALKDLLDIAKANADAAKANRESIEAIQNQIGGKKKVDTDVALMDDLMKLLADQRDDIDRLTVDLARTQADVEAMKAKAIESKGVQTLHAPIAGAPDASACISAPGMNRLFQRMRR